MKDRELYVVAGLGNPGDQYAATRHNMGFDTVDLLHGENFGPWKKSRDALISQGRIAGEKVMLVKPQKYMNLSGEAISDLMAYYKVSLDKLIVAYDDIDLAPGCLRVRKNGGAGTHNGMRNIVLHLGENFARVRIGVGKPEFGDLADYVLAKPKAEDRELLDQGIKKAAQAIETAIARGLEETMTRFNRG